MQKTLSTATFLLLGVALTNAFADREDAVDRLQADVRIQDGRAHELENVARWDDETARTLHRQAADARRHAQWMNDRANDYSASVSRFDEGRHGRRELERLADDLRQFAQRDNDFANQRENLAHSLEDQAHAARDAARAHHESVDHFNDVIDHLEEH